MLKPVVYLRFVDDAIYMIFCFRQGHDDTYYYLMNTHGSLMIWHTHTKHEAHLCGVLHVLYL